MYKREPIDSVLYQKTLDSINDLMLTYRKQIVDFYSLYVKTKPYAAFDALGMATLEVMPDSTLKRYFSMLPKKVQKSPPMADVFYRLTGFRENVKRGKNT